MPLFSKSEKNQVEVRPVLVRPILGEIAPERLLILTRGNFGIRKFRRHWMHILSRTRDHIQQSLSSHAVVALWVGKRHVTLVSPENVHICPWDLVSKSRRE